MDPLRRLTGLLISSSMTLSTAESCTGGAIAKALTDRPGSSAYFLGGVVAYANHVKHAFLGVKQETLERYGAVSEETCREMCLGIRDATGSDVAVSVTGIAGPSGGSPGKPVGTVYAGFLAGEEVVVRRYHFMGGRTAVRARAVRAILSALADLLEVES